MTGCHVKIHVPKFIFDHLSVSPYDVHAVELSVSPYDVHAVELSVSYDVHAVELSALYASN